MNDLLTISEADRRLGSKGNNRLLKKLLDFNRIPYTRAGNAILVDSEGFELLKNAYEAWRDRPRLYSKQPTAP